MWSGDDFYFLCIERLGREVDKAQARNRVFAKVIFYSLFCTTSLLVGICWRVRNLVFRDGRNFGRRILLFQFGHMGDIVHTIPLLKNLKLNDQKSEVTLVTGPWNVQIAEGMPWVDHVITHHHPLSDRTREFRCSSFACDLMVLAQQIVLQGYDVGISVNGHINSLAYLYSCNARWKVGFDYNHHGCLLDLAIPQDESIYEKDRLLVLLGAMGYRLIDDGFELSYLLDERPPSTSRSVGSRLIGLFPGASIGLKRWGADRYAMLADRIRETGLGDVIILGGPDDKAAVERVAGLAMSHPHIRVVRGVRELATVISHCAVFVSNDTGPMHLSVALGVPTIGLFGPANKYRWAPREPHVCINPGADCSPCDYEYDVCAISPDGCMPRISVDRVFASIEQLLVREDSREISPPRGRAGPCR